jgi:hypothetical protein
MSKYLIQTTEVYRVDTEVEVENLIAEAKEETIFDVVKYNCEHKERKQKGDVIDDYYKVSIVKSFTLEKEPDRQVLINYEI